jgi:hypothetical protein
MGLGFLFAEAWAPVWRGRFDWLKGLALALGCGALPLFTYIGLRLTLMDYDDSHYRALNGSRGVVAAYALLGWFIFSWLWDPARAYVQARLNRPSAPDRDVGRMVLMRALLRGLQLLTGLIALQLAVGAFAQVDLVGNILDYSHGYYEIPVLIGLLAVLGWLALSIWLAGIVGWAENAALLGQGIPEAIRTARLLARANRGPAFRLSLRLGALSVLATLVACAFAGEFLLPMLAAAVESSLSFDGVTIQSAVAAALSVASMGALMAALLAPVHLHAARSWSLAYRRAVR